MKKISMLFLFCLASICAISQQLEATSIKMARAMDFEGSFIISDVICNDDDIYMIYREKTARATYITKYSRSTGKLKYKKKIEGVMIEREFYLVDEKVIMITHGKAKQKIAFSYSWIDDKGDLVAPPAEFLSIPLKFGETYEVKIHKTKEDNFKVACLKKTPGKGMMLSRFYIARFDKSMQPTTNEYALPFKIDFSSRFDIKQDQVVCGTLSLYQFQMKEKAPANYAFILPDDGDSALMIRLDQPGYEIVNADIDVRNGKAAIVGFAFEKLPADTKGREKVDHGLNALRSFMIEPDFSDGKVLNVKTDPLSEEIISIIVKQMQLARPMVAVSGAYLGVRAFITGTGEVNLISNLSVKTNAEYMEDADIIVFHYNTARELTWIKTVPKRFVTADLIDIRQSENGAIYILYRVGNRKSDGDPYCTIAVVNEAGIDAAITKEIEKELAFDFKEDTHILLPKIFPLDEKRFYVLDKPEKDGWRLSEMTEIK